MELNHYQLEMEIGIRLQQCGNMLINDVNGILWAYPIYKVYEQYLSRFTMFNRNMDTSYKMVQ